jgi:hypothetical protein
VYASQARYAGGQAAAGGGATVTRVRSWYDGTRKLPRLAASLVEGFRLALAATRDTDLVISLTDPPLLGLWIGLMRRMRKFHWIEWTMDLYPEAFAAAGLVTPRNFIFRALHALMRSRLPDRYLALGPQQAQFLEHARGAVPAFILPCGISGQAAGPAPDWRREFTRHPIVAYAGNLGEAHSESILLELVRRADPARVRFLLALYGAKADAVRAALAANPHLIWREKISHADLAQADVHLATLKPQWTHVCVPSKAVSSVCLGRPILFAGIAGSDNWTLLQRAGWLIAERDDGSFDTAQIDAALAAIADPVQFAEKSAAALALRTELLSQRDQCLDQVAQWIRQEIR